MKARGKIILLALAALLICWMGWAILWGRREPWATIQFTKAQFSNDGSLIFDYHYKVSSDAFLHETEFQEGVQTLDMRECGSSLFGWPRTVSGHTSIGLYSSEIAVPPSMLVETGRNYTLKLHDPLRLYDFTNKSGTRYQAQFSLE